MSINPIPYPKNKQSFMASHVSGDDYLALVLYGIEADLNSVISASKKHWSGYSNKKKKLTSLVTLQVKGIKPIEFTPAIFKFKWYCKNKRKDPDNICFTKKYILDGFVEAGLMANDGWKQVYGFSDEFYIDKQNPRVEVIITKIDGS